MIKNLYNEQSSTELILRDKLALERTALANERTLLSYVRTMIGLIAIGGTLLKLFTDWLMVMTGWLCLVIGLVVLVIGFARYLRLYFHLYTFEQADMELKLKSDRLQYALWKVTQQFHL